MLICLLVCFVWAVGCLMFDSINTNRGLREGVAVEGNALIVAIAGNKPKLWQLLTIDGTIRLAMLALALFLPTPDGLPYAWYAAFSGAFTAYGIKNIRGGRQWRWLLANSGKPLPVQNSAWQQFLGFWG